MFVHHQSSFFKLPKIFMLNSIFVFFKFLIKLNSFIIFIVVIEIFVFQIHYEFFEKIPNVFNFYGSNSNFNIFLTETLFR